jgi:hypothetical protein
VDFLLMELYLVSALVYIGLLFVGYLHADPDIQVITC